MYVSVILGASMRLLVSGRSVRRRGPRGLPCWNRQWLGLEIRRDNMILIRNEMFFTAALISTAWGLVLHSVLALFLFEA